MMASLSRYTAPQQTVIVSCRGSLDNNKSDAKDNLITVDWHTQINIEPPLYMISIGKTRHSHKLITEGRCFCVNFMSVKYSREVLYCGRNSGRFIDKYRECKFSRLDSESIDCGRIGEAEAYLECEVISELDYSDHTLFIGKVLKAVSKSSGNDNRIFHMGQDSFTTLK
jgi:flavin reductase (DIM6/NTAB) family NADH-FMN oxidoreductase RutF